MKKNILTIILIVFIFIGGLYYIFFSKSREHVLINYKGNNLKVSVDGSLASKLPTTGNYYLVSYSCDNDNTEIIWNNEKYELTISNGKGGGNISCNLIFSSNPLLSEMPVGSYVAYEGKGGEVGTTSVACMKNGSASSSTATDATEAPNSCLGQNAREDLDTSGYTYGYCGDEEYKYYVKGWRLAYIDNISNKAVIVSAGSPECNSRTSSTANETYIKEANALALKYCNPDYVDGNCTCGDANIDGLCDNPSTDAWTINDNDFYNITKAISGVGKRLTSASSSLGDDGGTLGSTKYCSASYSYHECGYNNDLIDNGGFYWFAARYSSTDMNGVYSVLTIGSLVIPRSRMRMDCALS